MPPLHPWRIVGAHRTVMISHGVLLISLHEIFPIQNKREREREGKREKNERRKTLWGLGRRGEERKKIIVKHIHARCLIDGCARSRTRIRITFIVVRTSIYTAYTRIIRNLSRSIQRAHESHAPRRLSPLAHYLARVLSASFSLKRVSIPRLTVFLLLLLRPPTIWTTVITHLVSLTIMRSNKLYTALYALLPPPPSPPHLLFSISLFLAKITSPCRKWTRCLSAICTAVFSFRRSHNSDRH